MATYISLELTTIIRDAHHEEGREPVLTGTFSRVKSQLMMDQDGADALHAGLMHHKEQRERRRDKTGADFRECLARGDDMLDDDLQGLLQQCKAPVFYLDDTKTIPGKIIPAREVMAHDGIVTARDYYTWSGLLHDPHDHAGNNLWDHHYDMPVPARMRYNRLHETVTFDYFTRGEHVPPSRNQKEILTDPVMSACYQTYLPYAYHVAYPQGQTMPCAMAVLRKDKFSGDVVSHQMQPHEIALYQRKITEYYLAQREKTEKEREPFTEFHALFSDIKSVRVSHIIP